MIWRFILLILANTMRAVATVNLDTAVDADESEHFVTVNRVTTSGQRKVESFQVPVDEIGRAHV